MAAAGNKAGRQAGRQAGTRITPAELLEPRDARERTSRFTVMPAPEPTTHEECRRANEEDASDP